MKRLQYINELEGRKAKAEAGVRELRSKVDRAQRQHKTLAKEMEGMSAEVRWSCGGWWQRTRDCWCHVLGGGGETWLVAAACGSCGSVPSSAQRGTHKPSECLSSWTWVGT